MLRPSLMMLNPWLNACDSQPLNAAPALNYDSESSHGNNNQRSTQFPRFSIFHVDVVENAANFLCVNLMAPGNLPLITHSQIATNNNTKSFEKWSPILVFYWETVEVLLAHRWALCSVFSWIMCLYFVIVSSVEFCSKRDWEFSKRNYI